MTGTPNDAASESTEAESAVTNTASAHAIAPSNGLGPRSSHTHRREVLATVGASRADAFAAAGFESARRRASAWIANRRRIAVRSDAGVRRLNVTNALPNNAVSE